MNPISQNPVCPHRCNVFLLQLCYCSHKKLEMLHYQALVLVLKMVRLKVYDPQKKKIKRKKETHSGPNLTILGPVKWT